MEGIFVAWGRFSPVTRPNLSIEITRECPLRCPGCYAYGDDHLGGDVTLRDVSDFKGDAARRRRAWRSSTATSPLHLSIVGGEPLVRFRELNELLPQLAARGVYTQVVTSAVRPIPSDGPAFRRLQIVVSIDGLQPEHDERRKPATYDRILKHIVGHQITVHCTVTRQQVRRPGYLEEFVEFWSDNPDTRQIWVSLYTPQIGEVSAERLTPSIASASSTTCCDLRTTLSEAEDAKGLIEAYAHPPQSPGRTASFAQTTTCVSADFDDADHAVPVRRESRLLRSAAASPRRGLKPSAVTSCPAASAWAPSSRRRSGRRSRPAPSRALAHRSRRCGRLPAGHQSSRSA